MKSPILRTTEVAIQSGERLPGDLDDFLEGAIVASETAPREGAALPIGNEILVHDRFAQLARGGFSELNDVAWLEGRTV